MANYFKFKKTDIHRCEYKNGGVCLRVIQNGELVSVLTAWVPGIEPGHVAVKDYSENEGVLKDLTEMGVVSQPIRYEKSGWVELAICALL